MGIYAKDVQKLYIAYFNRPADVLGLAYWEDQVAKNGGSTAAVANAFSASQEYKDLYAGKSTAAIIDAIYQNLFGRSAEPAGLTYWGTRLDAGVFNIGNIVTAVMTGAQNTDATSVANKATAADAFTTALDTSAEIIAYSGAAANTIARTWLATVTSDAATLTAATGSLATVTANVVANTTVSAGSTFTLTTGIDNVTGSNGNDTFLGDYSINGANTSTVQSSDKIDGGAGFDSLRLFNVGGTAASTINLPQVANVENITLVNPTATAATTLNIANAAGVTEVALEGAPAAAINFTGLTSATNVLVKGDAGNTASAHTIGATVGTTDTSGKLTLSGSADAGTVNFTGGALTGLNVTSTGAVANKVAGLTVTTGKLSTLTVSGDKALTITGTLAADLTKLDSSASTAGVTATLAAATAATTIAGGAGAEKITVTAPTAAVKFTVDLGAGNDTLKVTDLSKFDATSTFVGGDGTDILALTSSAGVTSTTAKLFTGFETLQVAANGSAAETFDPTLFSGVTSYQVAASTQGVTLSNLVANANVTVIGDATAAGGVNLLLKDSSGASDVLTLTFDNGKTAATATATEAGVTIGKLVTMASASNGVETLNLVSSGKVGATATTLNTVTLDTADTVLKTINITGDQAFKVTTGAAGANLTKIDGVNATGKLTIDASGATNGAININGGSASDTISSAKGGAIYGGGAGDAITLNTGTETVIYKSASDSLFALKADGTLDTTKTDSVTSFTSGTDKLDLTSLGFTANTDKVVVAKTAASLAALQTLAGTADFYTDASTIARGVVAVTVGADTFVFADANHDHAFNAANDLVIKVVGSTVVTADIVFG